MSPYWNFHQTINAWFNKTFFSSWQTLQVLLMLFATRISRGHSSAYIQRKRCGQTSDFAQRKRRGSTSDFPNETLPLIKIWSTNFSPTRLMRVEKRFDVWNVSSFVCQRCFHFLRRVSHRSPPNTYSYTGGCPTGDLLFCKLWMSSHRFQHRWFTCFASRGIARDLLQT